MKKKICSSCGIECFLWKSTPKLCKSCALKNSTPIGEFTMTSNKTLQSTKTFKPINKQSDKEKKRQAAYTVLKKEFIKSRQYCEAKLPGCINIASDVHHLFMGADRYKYFLDSTTWKSICRSCHHIVHDELSAEELIELGLRLKE